MFIKQGIIYLFIACLSVIPLYAQEQPEPVTTSMGLVPAGFEHLNNDYYGSASVFLGRDELGQANIDYKDLTDLITLSSQAQQMIINDVKDKLTPEGLKQVKAQLKKTMHANSRLQNFYQARSNEKVSIYYNYKSLETYVFIPNKFFKKQEASYAHEQYLIPEKGIDHSPALSSEVRYEYDKYNAEPYYWQTNGILTSGPLNVIYDANSGLDDHFNDLHLEYFAKKYIYSAGYLTSFHNNTMAPSGNIWGVAAVSSTRMMNPIFMSAYQTPFSIYLDKTYEVTINYRGKKLFSQVLPMGENIIDTSNFPAGTYSVDIQKKDLLSGTTTTESEMFYGSRGQYNSLYSGFEVYAGYESKYFGSSSSERKPYLRISNGYNFLDGEVDLSYIHGQDINFLGAEYNFLNENSLDYSFSAYISQYFDWYFGGNLSYRDGPRQYLAYYRNGYQDNDYQAGRQREAGGKIIFNAKPWYVYVNGIFRDTKDYQLSSMVSKDHQWFDYPVRFSLSNSYDGEEIKTLFSVQMSLKKDAFSASSSLSQNEEGNRQININADYVKPEYFLRQRYSQSTDKNTTDSYYADMGYQSQYGELEGNAYFSTENGHIKGTSLGYKLKTNVLLTPSSITFSKDYFSSGFLVDLPYIGDDKEHIFTIDNKEYPQGKNVFIRKQDFNQSNVLIGLLTPDYSVKYTDESKFFFPNNVFTLHPILAKSCFVSFTLNLPSEGFYTIVGREDEVFGISGDLTTFQLEEGEKILIKDLSDESVCDTGVIAACQSNHDELGILQCKKTTQTQEKEVSKSSQFKNINSKIKPHKVVVIDVKELDTLKQVFQSKESAPESVKMYLAYALLHHR